MKRILGINLSLVLGVVFSSCQIHQVDQHPSPLVPAGGTFSQPAGKTKPATCWWLTFNDEILSQLVNGALHDNLELKAAWARLSQAQARVVQAGAGHLPSLAFQSNASRAKSSQRITGIPGMEDESSTYSLSFASSYEVDLWGRVAALDQAAQVEQAATRLDLETMAMTISTQVADTWFSLIQERALLDLLERQIKTSRTFLQLVELRFATGQASAVDVFQQRRQVAGTEAEIAPARSRLSALLSSLAMLQGLDPVGYEPPGRAGFPELPPLPGPGLPAELLANRPDIAAARLRVTVADQRLGVAIADRLPALRLTGSVGYQESQLTDLFDDWVWNLAAGLTAPLFQGGRLAAQEEEARARLRELTCRFSQAFLQGVKEVEDALAAEKQQTVYLDLLARQESASRAALSEARVRFSNGQGDYLQVLAELQVLQKLERGLIAARRQLFAQRVRLHRSLGGTWPRELKLEKTPVMGEVK